jgi:hypothetical protein
MITTDESGNSWDTSYMGPGTGNYLPQNYNVGPAPVAPMGSSGNPAVPYPNQPASRPATFRVPAQYSNPYQQQFTPQQQQRFSMPPPPQRSYPQQQQQYNLAGIMGARNLGQQQQMPRPQQQFYQPQPQQMTGRANMSPQDVNAARNALGLGNLPQDGRKPIMSQEQAQAYQQQLLAQNPQGGQAGLNQANMSQLEQAGLKQADMSPDQQRAMFQNAMNTYNPRGQQQYQAAMQAQQGQPGAQFNPPGMNPAFQGMTQDQRMRAAFDDSGMGHGQDYYAQQAAQRAAQQPRSQADLNQAFQRMGMPSNFAPQAMGGKGGMPSSQQSTPQAMGGKGAAPQRPSSVGGKGASQD